MTKRSFLAGVVAGTLLPSAGAGEPPGQGRGESGTLLDRDRVSHLLRQVGLDALLLDQPENVYYATGVWPALGRMGVPGSTFALVPRDQKIPIAHIGPQFVHYYTVADIGFAGDVEPYLVTAPALAGAAAPIMFHPLGNAAVGDRERNRRALSSTGRMYASPGNALEAALGAAGHRSIRLGFDGLEAERLAREAAPRAALQPASELMRHLRMVKTPRELGLMRTASAATVSAALATALQMRSLGTLKNVRNHFNGEVSRLGNIPVFMVVHGVIAEDYDEPLVDGTAILIDCVSHYRGYHSDYGRTVFIGEPPEPMRRRVAAMGTAWNELRARLRPGMRFSEIRSLGRQILAKIHPGMEVPFNPHIVGLAHSEQPRSAVGGGALDVALEPGMVISVDCPLMEASQHGTAHIEDLTLITADGTAPMHEVGNQTITV